MALSAFYLPAAHSPFLPSSPPFHSLHPKGSSALQTESDLAYFQKLSKTTPGADVSALGATRGLRVREPANLRGSPFEQGEHELGYVPGPFSRQGVFFKRQNNIRKDSSVPLQAGLSSQAPHLICILTTRMQFHPSDSSQICSCSIL